MQLTTRDAARLLGVSDSTLHRWLKSGELHATRVDGLTSVTSVCTGFPSMAPNSTG